MEFSTVYQSIVFPFFEGTGDCNIQAVQVLQNKATQTVGQATPRTCRRILFDKTGWLTVRQLIFYHTLLTVFNIRTSGEPEYLGRSLKNDTRSGRIQQPQLMLQIEKKSVGYQSIKYWKMLPSSIRSADKICQFKRLTKDWVLRNINRFEE